MTALKYNICKNCIMDTSDPQIFFNAEGICNHCIEFETVTRKSWHPDEEGQKNLKSILEKIKKDGCNREYDCIIGLSGGVDSSYLALKASDWGLRPLVIHVDAGWNSETAVGNIEKIVKHCNFDLHTHVVDWEEMRDLHLAYLRAGVANQDVPQDHIFFSSLYHFATKNKIRYIFSGGNIATESIFPKAWHGSAMDAVNLKAIHKKHGEHPLKSYKTISFFEYYLWYPFIKKLTTARPLNYMPYNKEMAINELKKTIDWQPYGRKHGESLFTKLFQNFYLPQKFGYDKRRPHLSSLIVSGQLSREDALIKINEPLYDKKELEIDISFFCKKLNITREEFDTLINSPLHHYTEYKNWNQKKQALKKIQAFVEKITKQKFSTYS